MTKVESLLADAKSLTNAERRRLAELLLQQADLEAEADEKAAGLRGIRAWTESASGEDWSEYYPDTLGSQGSSER
jgi:hypothetical protein